MRDLIKARAAQLKRVQSKHEEVQTGLRELVDAMRTEFGHLSVSGQSAFVRVEPLPGSDDPPLNLCLRFTDDRLMVVASDASETDFSAWIDGIWLLENCPPHWLERLTAKDVVTSLIRRIGGHGLDDIEGRLDGALASVRALLADESGVIDAEMADSLTTAGDENLHRLWQDAVDATRADSADALTRCSRFLEAVCAKILRERGVALPKDKSMSPLVKACLETLTWPAEKEAEEDVKKLLGGIQSITQGIGALRTHFGTAHGATSHLPPLDPGYAVFVKQATVAAATFLLDRHQARPLAVDDSSPASAG